MTNTTFSSKSAWNQLGVMACDRCNLKTSDISLFQAHACRRTTAMISYNVVKGLFCCSLCRAELKDTSFEEHLEQHLTLRPYSCYYCSELFKTREDVCAHVKNHIPNGTIEQIGFETCLLRISKKTKEYMMRAKNFGKCFFEPRNKSFVPTAFGVVPQSDDETCNKSPWHRKLAPKPQVSCLSEHSSGLGCLETSNQSATLLKTHRPSYVPFCPQVITDFHLKSNLLFQAESSKTLSYMICSSNCGATGPHTCVSPDVSMLLQPFQVSRVMPEVKSLQNNSNALSESEMQPHGKPEIQAKEDNSNISPEKNCQGAPDLESAEDSNSSSEKHSQGKSKAETLQGDSNTLPDMLLQGKAKVVPTHNIETLSDKQSKDKPKAEGIQSDTISCEKNSQGAFKPFTTEDSFLLLMRGYFFCLNCKQKWKDTGDFVKHVWRYHLEEDNSLPNSIAKFSCKNENLQLVLKALRDQTADIALSEKLTEFICSEKNAPLPRFSDQEHSQSNTLKQLSPQNIPQQSPSPGVTISSADLKPCVEVNTCKGRKRLVTSFYQCGFPDCVFSCHLPVDLLTHNENAHPMATEIPCVYCGKMNKTGSSLFEHLDSHIGQNGVKALYVCSLIHNTKASCIVENRNIKKIFTLLKKAADQKAASILDQNICLQYRCNLCCSDFFTLEDLRTHLNKSLLKVLACKYCRGHFLDSESMLQHLSSDHRYEVKQYRINEKMLCKDRKSNDAMYTKLLEERKEFRYALSRQENVNFLNKECFKESDGERTPVGLKVLQAYAETRAHQSGREILQNSKKSNTLTTLENLKAHDSKTRHFETCAKKQAVTNSIDMLTCITVDTATDMDTCVARDNAMGIDTGIAGDNANDIDTCIARDNEANNLDACISRDNEANNLDACISRDNEANDVDACIAGDNANDIDTFITRNNATEMDTCIPRDNANNSDTCMAENGANMSTCIAEDNTNDVDTCIARDNSNVDTCEAGVNSKAQMIIENKELDAIILPEEIASSELSNVRKDGSHLSGDPSMSIFFKCSVCPSETFSSYFLAKKHKKQHSDGKAAIIRFPEKSFDKSKTYKCFCSYTCAGDKAVMLKHIRSEHKYYACGYCGNHYTVKRFMENHLKYQHVEKKKNFKEHFPHLRTAFHLYVKDKSDMKDNGESKFHSSVQLCSRKRVQTEEADPSSSKQSRSIHFHATVKETRIRSIGSSSFSKPQEISISPHVMVTNLPNTAYGMDSNNPYDHEVKSNPNSRPHSYALSVSLSSLEKKAPTNKAVSVSSTYGMSIDYFPFQCHICKVCMKSIQDVLDHIRWLHSNDQINALVFDRRSQLAFSKKGVIQQRQVMDLEPVEQKHLCTACNFMSYQRSDVVRHVELVHSSKGGKGSVLSLVSPMQTETIPSTECWDGPKFTAMRSSAVAEHEQIPEISFFTVFKDDSHLSPLKQAPLRSLHYNCHLCSEVLSNEFNFKLHLARHKCFTCTSVLSSLNGLLLCSICGYVARSNADLAQHMDIHLTERRYACSHCDADDHKKTGLLNHIRKYHYSCQDVYVIDREMKSPEELRPKIVDIDPRLIIEDIFKIPPRHLNKRLRQAGVKGLQVDIPPI